MISKEKIRSLVEAHLDSECFLVDIMIHPGNKIDVRIDSERGINVLDCRLLSRAIEAGLDREEEDFELEVSSPGMEEPFKVKRQYFKNVGRQVEVLTEDGKMIMGKLTSAGEEGITVVELTGRKKNIENEINLNYNQIKQTRKTVTFK